MLVVRYVHSQPFMRQVMNHMKFDAPQLLKSNRAQSRHTATEFGWSIFKGFSNQLQEVTVVEVLLHRDHHHSFGAVHEIDVLVAFLAQLKADAIYVTKLRDKRFNLAP